MRHPEFDFRVICRRVCEGTLACARYQLSSVDDFIAEQHPAGRVGNPLDIANVVLFLASEKASFITGENICVDGGMTRQMIYHNDFGWKLGEEVHKEKRLSDVSLSKTLTICI